MSASHRRNTVATARTSQGPLQALHVHVAARPRRPSHCGSSRHHLLGKLRDDALHVDLRPDIAQLPCEDSGQLPVGAHARGAQLAQESMGTTGAQGAPTLSPPLTLLRASHEAGQLAHRGPQQAEGVQAQEGSHAEVGSPEQVAGAIRHG